MMMMILCFLGILFLALASNAQEKKTGTLQDTIVNVQKNTSKQPKLVENRGFKLEVPFEETNDLYEYATINSKFTFGNFNVLDSNDMSPLMTAASVGNYEAVKNYLLAGANPSFANSQGMTSLHFAVKGGFYNTMVELLNPTSAVANSTSSGEGNSSPTARLSVIQKNAHGISPLLLAVELNYFVLVEYMVRHDKSLFDSLLLKIDNHTRQLEKDLEKFRLNHESLSTKSSSSSQNVLSRDSIHFNPNKKPDDSSASSASSAASKANQDEIYQRNKNQILESIKVYENQYSFILAKSQIRQKKVINDQLTDGTTLLMISCQMGTTRMSSLLLEYGAQVRHENAYADSALSMLATSPSFELLIKTNIVGGLKSKDPSHGHEPEINLKETANNFHTFISLMKSESFIFPLHLFGRKKRLHVQCASHSSLMFQFYSSTLNLLLQTSGGELADQLPTHLSELLLVNYLNSVGLVCNRFSDKVSGDIIQFTSPIHLLIDFPTHKYDLRLPSASVGAISASSPAGSTSAFAQSIASNNQTMINFNITSSFSNETFTYLPLLMSASRKNTLSFYFTLNNIPKNQRKTALLYTPPPGSVLFTIPGSGLSIKDYLVESYKTSSENRRKRLKQEARGMGEQLAHHLEEFSTVFDLFETQSDAALAELLLHLEGGLTSDPTECLLLMLAETGLPLGDKFQRTIVNKLKHYSFFD